LGKNLEAEDGEVEAAVVLGVGAEDLLVLGEDGAEVAAGQIGEIDVLPEQMILTAAPVTETEPKLEVRTEYV